MNGGWLLYVLAAVVILAAVASYWSARARRRPAADARATGVPWLVSGAALAFCLWSVHMERPALSYDNRAEPFAIAIAFDLSPSMLAIPDPAVAPGTPARYRRGTDVLLDMLNAMEERNEAALVAVVGFARRGEVIMGWNRDIAQAREVIRHAVSPEVFESPGTSMEAAAKTLAGAFDMLPREFEAARRLAILVSDGEDTMREASFGYATDIIARAGFEVIALQTGLFDADEGVPVYDRAGEFTGFERMGGALYTRPDVGAMQALTTSGQNRGLYLRAEEPEASRRVLEFAHGGTAAQRGFDAALLPTLGMFGAVFVLLGWLIR